MLAVYATIPALAQGVGAQPASYQPVLDEAIHEFSVGNYAEALTLFREAQQLWPNARALRAIGRCQYELGAYVEAHDSLEEALRSPVRPLDGAQRSETEQVLTRVREHLARYTIVAEPRTAVVRIDGGAVAVGADGSVVLAVGPHTIEATATGYLAVQRQVMVEPQRDERIELALAPLVEAEQEAAPTVAYAEPSARSDQPLRKKWWLWTSVVGAAAVAAVATVLIVKRDEPAPRAASGGTEGVSIGVPAALGAP